MKTIILRSEKQEDHVIELIRGLPKNDKKPEYAVTIEKYEKARSRQMNSYYWVCLRHISQCKPNGMVYLPDTYHHYFAELFLQPVEKIDLKTGEVTYTARSTAKLSEKKFLNYFDAITDYCIHEWGIILPDSREYYD